MTDTSSFLKETREKRGLTLDDVEQATRIPRHYLEMMEGEGDTRLISDPLYLVHYVRRYAAHLGIDEAEQLAAQFIRENTRLQGAKRSRPPKKEEKSPRVLPWLLLLVVVVGLGAAYVFDPSLLSGVLDKDAEETTLDIPTAPREEAKPSSVIETSEPAVTASKETPRNPMMVLQPEAEEILPAATAPEKPTTGPEQTTLARGDSTASTADGNTATAEPSSALQNDTGPATEESASTTTSVEKPQRGQRLQIAAREKAWVRVIADGQKPQDVMMEPGDSRTWSAEKQFVLTFGNAGGVDVTLNGKKLPPLGSSGQVIRNYQLPKP